MKIDLENKKVTMSTKEYFSLEKASMKLDFLECGGVNNWDGYGDSLYPDDDEDDYDNVVNNLKDELNLK